MSNYTEDARKIGEELNRLKGELDVDELWHIVKLCKLIRRSCRNNVAFNNAMKSAFPYASFNTIQKLDREGKSYPGLEIRIREKVVNGSDESD